MFLYSIMCENAEGGNICRKKSQKEKNTVVEFSTNPMTYLNLFQAFPNDDFAKISAYSFNGTPECPSTFTKEIFI